MTIKEQAIKWVQEYFAANGNENTKAIIGISGGKDSSTVAALCCAALGKERVIGVMMPNGVQSDIDDSKKLCNFLGIECYTVNIEKSFNGITGEINIATGKLVKASKASLVTYKLEGGYFTTPRWGKGIRKGKMHGSIVNIYNKEDLEKLSPEEITDLVKKDLYEDAYQKQSQNPIAYKGKNLAEGIEHALCLCPECKQIDTLFSKKNSVFCKNCDFTTSIDIYGYFDENCKFKTVLQWDEFQQEELKKLIREKSSEKSEFIFSDDEVTLKTVKAEHQEEIIGTGKFSMFTDKFIFNLKILIIVSKNKHQKPHL